MEPPGHKVLVVNVIVVGPFEKEEEGTGVASDVVNVEGEEPPGHKALVVNVVVVGPFEKEEEGTGVASDMVKVQGEDLATPGPLT